jgi:hypothetical protein
MSRRRRHDVLQRFPALNRMVQLCDGIPEAQAALADFLKASESMEADEIAKVFEDEMARLRRMVN